MMLSIFNLKSLKFSFEWFTELPILFIRIRTFIFRVTKENLPVENLTVNVGVDITALLEVPNQI